MEDRAPATPLAGPPMAFLSNASTSPARDARVPEATPAGLEGHAPNRAATRAKAGASSAEPPGVTGRRLRSRSPHAAPSAFHVHDGASEGRVTAAVKLLEKNLEELIARVSAQETSRKWAEDSAKRLDAIESQVREQTKEANAYARHK